MVFLHPSYYHFFYLARALRKRGWDAVSVNVWDPDGPFSPYFHGEDINLYDADPVKCQEKLATFYEIARKRFHLLHFSGDGCASFYPDQWFSCDDRIDPETFSPPDFVEWKALGKKIAYTSSGCNSAIAQTSIHRWSVESAAGSVCHTCPWQLRPDICNDEKNLGWGRVLQRFVDLIFAEGLPALDYMATPGRVIRDPVTTALDPDLWKPGLRVPDAHKIARKPGEVLIYHGVGNYDTRNVGGRNIKGTPAVVSAIERLQGEGYPARLKFVTGMMNTEVRFVQAQCDIIVDQLNFGRYGATAREGMMLGKPVVCYINRKEPIGAKELNSLNEVPLVSATAASIYETLRYLLEHPEECRAVGALSRRYALKWHSADACAERYEKIYDQLMEGREMALEI